MLASTSLSFDLSVFDLDMGAVNLISADAAKRYQAVPVGFCEDGSLLLAMANPTNVLTIDATDPKSGTAEFKASAIRIDKLTAGATA